MRWYQALTLAAMLVAAPAFAAGDIINPRTGNGGYLPESLPRAAAAPLQPPVVAAAPVAPVAIQLSRRVVEMECTKSVPTPADRASGLLSYHVMFDRESHLFVVNAYSKLVLYRVTQIDGNDQWVVVRGETAAHTLFESTFKIPDNANVDERMISFNPRTGERVADSCDQMFE